MVGKQSKPKRRTVADLVKAKAAAAKSARFTPDQLAFVRDVLESNDAEPNLKRKIGSRAVHRVLVEDYEFTGGSVDTLERWAREEFCRQSWGRK
jgi:hypothetical protein